MKDEIMDDWYECPICGMEIAEGNVCDSCEYALDDFMEAAEHISGASLDDVDYPEDFWNDVFDAGRRGCLVFDRKKLIAVGKFETTYRIA